MFFFCSSVTEYIKWKSSIDASIVHSPKSPRRPVLTWSSVEDDRTQAQSVPLLVKAQGDSIDRDDVFQKAEDVPSSPTGNPVRPNTPLNPSPRVSDLKGNENMLRIEFVARGDFGNCFIVTYYELLELTVVSNNGCFPIARRLASLRENSFKVTKATFRFTAVYRW